MTNDRQKKVVAELEKRIPISVAWDGYYDADRLEDQLQADIDTGNSFPFSDHKAAIMDKYYNGVERYESIRNQTKELEELVKEEAWKIVEHFDSMAQDVDQISDSYYDIAAKRFCNKHKNKRVFIAPDRWLPIMFK